MNIQQRYSAMTKNAARMMIAAITLAAAAGATSVSAMPSAAADVLAHPPVTGDCASCHPKPSSPKRAH